MKSIIYHELYLFLIYNVFQHTNLIFFNLTTTITGNIIKIIYIYKSVKIGGIFIRRYTLTQPLLVQKKDLSSTSTSNNKNEQLQLALNESEANLKLLQKTANIGSWQWNYIEKQFYFSDEFYRIFGILDINSDFHTDYKDILEKKVQLAIKSGIVETTEYKVLRENDEIRWVRTNGMCLYDFSGNPTKIVGTIQDITEWKNAELLIKQDYKFLQTLIDTIPSPIFYKDEKGIYKYCNTAFTDYLGLKREKIIGHTVYDISPKNLADIYYKADMKLIQSKEKQIYEAHVKYADKSIHDILFTKGAVVNKEGLVKGLVGTMIDITERKNMENKINKLLKLKESMLDINHALLEVNNIKELFVLLLEKVTQALDNSELGCILVLNSEENLKIIATKGYSYSNAEKFDLKLKDSFFGMPLKEN